MSQDRLDLHVRRIHEQDTGDAGYRVLVDRLWPRGIKKADAALDEWPKDVAPSTDLRHWYGHDVERFDEFVRRYRAELGRPPASDAVGHLLGLAHQQRVTLLTATHDVEHSGARALCDHLRELGPDPEHGGPSPPGWFRPREVGSTSPGGR